MEIPTAQAFTLLVRQAQIDAELLIGENETSNLSPENTDWDGESFQYSWSDSLKDHFTEEQKDMAREVYLAVFWNHVEFFQSSAKELVK